METIQKEIVAVKLALAGQPNLVELAGDVKRLNAYSNKVIGAVFTVGIISNIIGFVLGLFLKGH